MPLEAQAPAQHPKSGTARPRPPARTSALAGTQTLPQPGAALAWPGPGQWWLLSSVYLLRFLVPCTLQGVRVGGCPHARPSGNALCAELEFIIAALAVGLAVEP